MQAKVQNIRPEKQEYNIVNTTLYELIEAISREIDPPEDRLVAGIVSDLLYRRLIRRPDSKEKSGTGIFLN
jgi:hypothetical protein